MQSSSAPAYIIVMATQPNCMQQCLWYSNEQASAAGSQQALGSPVVRHFCQAMSVTMFQVHEAVPPVGLPNSLLL